MSGRYRGERGGIRFRVFGRVLSTYTGVLIGATAVPGMEPQRGDASDSLRRFWDGQRHFHSGVEGTRYAGAQRARASVGGDRDAGGRVHRAAQGSRPEAAENGMERLAHADRWIVLRSSAPGAEAAIIRGKWKAPEDAAKGGRDLRGGRIGGARALPGAGRQGVRGRVRIALELPEQTGHLAVKPSTEALNR